MRFPNFLVPATALAHLATAQTLASVCTNSHVANVLPEMEGLVLDPNSVTAQIFDGWLVVNYTNQPNWPAFDFCNVTFQYSHVDKHDTITLTLWMPDPQDFQNRYLSTGGSGWAIDQGSYADFTLSLGPPYGAVAAQTDGGFGVLALVLNDILLSNDSMDYDALYSFSYTSQHELAFIGPAFTRNFFDMAPSSKLYTYYQGCSEGGREGMSQIQRFGGEFDGAIIGAPAVRYAFQQVNHLFPAVAENTMDTFPPSCMFNHIVNATIDACDGLDGNIDGVVARTDLCSLHFDISKTVGQPYSCGELSPAWSQLPSPAVNGTVTKADVALAKTILGGLHDSSGKRVYVPFQPTSQFVDAQTVYNLDGTYSAQISSTGGPWVSMFLEEQMSQTIPDFTNVTYDNLKEWMNLGYNEYYSTLVTDWPDLTPFQSGGGKIIHYHGESDNAIPTASSIRYYEAVRKIMYPELNITEGAAAMGDWYRLFLVPGAAHCGPNANQPNGPWPQTNMQIMIDWVESNTVPTTLNGTILQGAHVGDNQQMCAWPYRPMWNNGTDMQCVFDKAGYEAMTYNLNAIAMPVY